MDLTTAFFGSWLIASLLSAPQMGAPQDLARAQYYEAVATASEMGLPMLVKKLDAITAAYPEAPVIPVIQETIQIISILHPDAIPDWMRRFESLKALSAANPAISQSIQRLESLRTYYAGASKDSSDQVRILNSSPLAGSTLGLFARADAALRGGAYEEAEDFASQAIEADPRSPLLANMHVILGLCSAYRGNAPQAAHHFQNALLRTPLPTLYGRTEDYLFTAYRFARAAANAPATVFSDPVYSSLAGVRDLRGPRALLFSAGRFLLLDRDRIISLDPDGRATEVKTLRQFQDFAVTPSQDLVYLAADGVDLGTGTPAKLSAAIAGKARPVDNLRSLAVDARGDWYLLDQNLGILRSSPSEKTTWTSTPVASIRGRLLRMDARGLIYLLSLDRRQVLVLTRTGEQLASVAPPMSTGRSPSIETFALDSLNHLYILESESKSIQIFAVNNAGQRIEAVSVAVIPLEERPQSRDLKLLALSSAGEMVLLGDNADSWVVYK